MEVSLTYLIVKIWRHLTHSRKTRSELCIFHTLLFPLNVNRRNRFPSDFRCFKSEKRNIFFFWPYKHAVLCKGKRWDKREENSVRLESKLPLSTSRISPLLFMTLTLHPKPYFHRLPSTSSHPSHILKKFRSLKRGTCTLHLWYAA